jgi:ABC-type nitrate/sulfonate/bicarbonate transport system substrate-binding protein
MAVPNANTGRAGRPLSGRKKPAAMALALATIIVISILGYSYYVTPRTPAPSNIVLGLSSYTNSAWPVFIANDIGIFHKYQLNVTAVTIGSGRNLITALQARQIDIAWTSPDVVISSALEGFQIVQVGASERTRPFYLITRPEITSLQQLKGRIGGVNSIGTGLTFTTMVAMLEKLGLDPSRDVTLVPISGGVSVTLAGVRAGKVDFVLSFDAPTARKLGLNVLLYIPDFIDVMYASGYTVTRTYLNDNKAVLKRFIMALGEATKYFFDHKEESKSILGKWLMISDPDSLESNYNDMSGVILKVPKISFDQLKSLLELMTPYTPKAANAEPRAFADNSIVNELESEGFYKNLWGT